MPTFYLIALLCFQKPPVTASFDNLRLEERDPAFHALKAGGALNGNTRAIVHANGFAWMAVDKNLYRYDGYQALKVLETPSLILDAVYKEQRIWVLCNEGVFVYDPLAGKTEDVLLPFENTHYTLISMAVLEGKRALVGSYEGVFFWQGSQWEQLFDGRCFEIFSDRDGSFWLGLDDYLVHLDSEMKEQNRIPLPNAFRPSPEIKSEAVVYRAAVHSLLRDWCGQLWVGTTHGIGILEENTYQLTRYELPVLGGRVYKELVEDLAEDEEGRLWVATRAGLHLIDAQGSYLTYFVRRSKTNDGLPGNNFRFAETDDRQCLWLGTYSGPVVLPALSRTVRSYSIEGVISLYYDDVNAVYWLTRGNEGRLGLCTVGGYFEQVAGGNLLDRLNPFPDRLPNQFSVLYAFKDSRNRFFLMAGQGLFQLVGKELKPYYYYDGWLLQSGNTVVEDHLGTLWLGTSAKIRRLDSGATALVDGPAILRGHTVLLEEPDGRILIYSGGFYRIDRQTEEKVSLRVDGKDLDPSMYMSGAPVAQDGDVLFFSRGGFYIWPKDNRLAGGFDLTFFPVANGFESHKALVRVNNRIWAVGNPGLVCFDLASGRIVRVRKAHGLHTDKLNGVQFLQGKLYLTGADGFSTFDPEAFVFPEPNPVKITSVKQGNRLPRYEDVDRLTLTRDEDYLSLSFASLDFSAAGDTSLLHYAYAMQPEGEQGTLEWIDLGTENRVSLVGLDPGDYTLRIKGTNSYGEWQEEKTVAIAVPQPLYATTQAFVLYFLLAAGVTAAVMRYRHQRRLALHYAGLDRLKDEFLANTSHELRTPLGGILGIVEGLLDGAAGALNEAQAANLGMVKSSAGRLKNLVNDLLDFSKLKENDLKIHPRAVDLYGAVEVVCALTKPLADDKRLVLVNAVPHDLPPLFADENRLQQILHNLIGNAVKFTETGTVTIAAHADGETIHCAVTDTGPGIAPEDQARIWRSFEQADGSLTRVQEGTGLGLTITRRLLELQGGTVDLTSAPGQGSTFRFTLPKAHGAAAPAPTAVQASSPVPTPATMTSALDPVVTSGAVVLVVDDEPINRHVVRNHLTMQGLRVIEAADGPAALEQVAAEKPDLVLLDVMMPRMSGYEVCRRLRETHARADLPIIFLTARGRIEDIVAGFEAGGNDYLVKPVLKAELLSRVDIHAQLLDVHRDLEARVTARTQELAVQTAEVQRRRDQLLMREKMVFLAALARGTAHEIHNPLNFINTLAELSHDTLTDVQARLARYRAEHPHQDLADISDMLDELADNLSRTGVHGAQARYVVSGLMRFGEDDKDPVPAPTDVFALFARYARLARGTHPHAEAAGVALVDAFAESEQAPEPRMVPAAQLSRILSLLVTNALDSCLLRAAGEPGYTGVVRLVGRMDGDTVHLEVCDNGTGIAADLRARIFEPFFTTHRGKEHLGLGLAVAGELTTGALHGSLTLDPTYADGARFLLRFHAPSAPDADAP